MGKKKRKSLGLTFPMVPGEEEVVEKLVGDILRRSPVRLVVDLVGGGVCSLHGSMGKRGGEGRQWGRE